jgi:hypothetical protein
MPEDFADGFALVVETPLTSVPAVISLAYHLESDKQGERMKDG